MNEHIESLNKTIKHFEDKIKILTGRLSTNNIQDNKVIQEELLQSGTTLDRYKRKLEKAYKEEETYEKTTEVIKGVVSSFTDLDYGKCSSKGTISSMLAFGMSIEEVIDVCKLVILGFKVRIVRYSLNSECTYTFNIELLKDITNDKYVVTPNIVLLERTEYKSIQLKAREEFTYNTNIVDNIKPR